MDDKINHPSHYGGGDNPYETIKVLKAWGLDIPFAIASAIKYLSRMGKKQGESQADDAKKARWYTNYLVEQLAPEADDGF